MKNMNALAAGLAVATLAAGCAEAPPHPAPTPVIEQTAVPSGPIDLSRVPEKLPRAVAAMIPRIVKVETFKAHEQGRDEDYGSGTGILMDDSHVLTAGHVVIDEDGKQHGDCDRTFISATTKESTGTSLSDDKPLYGTLDNVASIQAVTHPGKTDIAFLTRDTSGPEQFDEPGAPLKVRTTPLLPGEVVFIFGFGDDANKAPLNPREEALDEEGVALDHDSPRIIGAVVTRNITGDRVVTLTGLQGYGKLPEPEKHNRPGDSGGAAFTADGELVGILSEADVNMSPTDISYWTNNTKFINQPTGSQPSSVSAIQVITPDMFNNLQTLPPTQCSPMSYGP